MSKDIEFQEKINELEFHLSEANRKMGEKNNEISSIEQKYENEISKLNDELNEQRKQYEILKKKAVKLKEKAKLLESSKHSSKESLHEADKVEKMHLLEANPERQHHESTIIESNNSEVINGLQTELNSIKADNERTKYELENSNSELKRLLGELNALQLNHDESTKENEELKKKYDSLKVKALLLKEKLKKHEDHSHVEDEPAESQTATTTAHQKHEPIVESSTNELVLLKNQLDEKIDELNRISAENESTKNELTLTQTELKRVFDDYNSINLKHEELLAENETLKKKYETLRVKAHALKGKLKKSDDQQQQPHQDEEHQDPETNNKLAELEVKLKDLSDKESILSDEILKLKEENLNKDENISELVNRTEYLNSCLSKSMKSNEELLAECSRLNEVVKALENNQNTSESSQAIEELHTYKSLFEELRNENEQNKEYTKQVEDSLQRELLEKDNLKKEYEKLQQKALKLKALVKHSKSSQAKAIDESRSAECSSPFPVAEEHQQHLKSELNQSTLASSSAGSIESDSIELQRKLDELKDENNRIKHELDEVTHLKNEIEKLNNEIKLESEVFTAKISQLQSNLDKEKCEKDELRSEFNKLQEKTTKLMTKLKQKKKTSEAVSSNVGDGEHKEDAVKLGAAAVASEAPESTITDELNKRMLELSDENTSLKALINSLEDRNREFSDEKNDEILDLQDMNQKLEANLAEKVERIKELDQEIESLNQQLSSHRESSSDDLQASLLRRSIEQLERSLEEANMLRTDETAAANEKELKYKELIDEKEQEILRLRNELNSLTVKFEQFSDERKVIVSDNQQNSIINDLEVCVKIKGEQINKLENDLEMLENKNKSESNDWFTNDWNEVEKNVDDVDELKMEVERLERLLEEANKERNQGTKEEVDMLRRTIEASEIQHNQIVQAKESEIIQLNNEVERMRKLIDELNLSGKESGGDNSSGLSIMELEEIVKEKDAQIEQLKMDIDDMKKEKIEKDNDDNDWFQVDTGNDEIKRENDELKQKLDVLRSETDQFIKFKDVEIERLRSELDNLKQLATSTKTENISEMTPTSEIRLEESSQNQNDVVQTELERLKQFESSYELIFNENNHLKENLANIQQQANQMLYERDVQIAQLYQDNENMRQALANYGSNSGQDVEKVEHIQHLTQSNTNQSQNSNNNETISHLEAKIIELNSVIDSLKAENSTLNDNISQLNTKINELSANGDNNMVKLNEEIVRLREFEASYATIQTENNYLKESLASIQEQANQMLYERDAKINELIETTEKYKQNEYELIKVKNELTELLSSKNSKIVVLNDAENIEKEECVQQLNNDTTIKISQLEEEIFTLKSINSEHLNEIELKTAKIQELEGYINELKDKLSILEDNLSLNEFEISDLKQKLNQAYANIDNESIEKLNLIKNIDFMRNEIDKLKENEIKLTDEIDKLKPSSTITQQQQQQQHANNKKSIISNDQMIELTKNSIKESLENVQYQLNNKCCSHLEDQLNNCRLICDKVINKLDQLKSQNTSVNERIKSIESLIIESSSTITTSPSSPTSHLNEENTS